MPLTYLGLLLVLMDAPGPLETSEAVRRCPDELSMPSRHWALKAFQTMAQNGLCRRTNDAYAPVLWEATPEGAALVESKMNAIESLYYAQD